MNNTTIKLDVDLNDVSTEFPIAPAGTYLCLITKVEKGLSQAQQPKLALVMSNQEPIVCQVGNNQETVMGKELFRTSVSLQPKALFTLKQLVVAVGLPLSRELDYSQLANKLVKVKVSVQTVEDSTFNRVEKFLPAS